MLRLRIVTTALALVALIAPATDAATPEHKSTCKRSHSTTVAQNKLIRVFTRPGTDGAYTEGTDLVGCWRKTGRTRLLAYAFDDDYVSRAEFGIVRIRGRFAAFYTESYDISCKAACDPTYEPYRRHLNVVDVRLGSGFSVKIAERPAFNRLLLSEHGAIAWPQWLPANQIEVRVVDAAGEHAVDSGPIRPESLTMTPGGRLGWVRDGTPQSTVLARRTV